MTADLRAFVDSAPAWDGDEHEYLVTWARNRLLQGDFEGLDQKAINALTRACLMAPEGHVFGIVDYSGIEARVNAWAAGDEPALELFRTPGGDPYRALASRIFSRPAESFSKSGKERQLGKIGELGLGYGMGVKNFRTTGEKGGVDWAALKAMDPPMTPGRVVSIWRDAHPAIVKFWSDLEAGMMAAVFGEETEVGPVTWARVGDSVWAYLASGRPIVYQGVRIDEVVRTHEVVDDDGKPVLDENGEPRVRTAMRDELSYLSRRGRESTYGGKLCENVVQALAREIMAWALVRLERAGFPVVFHVHDEAVFLLKILTALARLKEAEGVMTELPMWAHGLPIGVEGFLSKRYRK